MKFQRVHKSNLQSYQRPQEISKLTPRYFRIQSKEISGKPLTQEQIDNQALQNQKMEATKLEIQAKYGTITPEGQERLGVLQAKMNNFWMQRKESSKGQPNLLEMPDLFTRRETRLAQQIQPQLQIGQPGDKYEQEANRVATDVVSQMHQPQSKDIPIQTASKLKHQVGVSDKRTASSESGNVVNTVDGIQCKVTQTDGDVIQLLGVQDIIKKFEQIGQENKVSTDSQPWLSDKRKPTTDRITNKSIKAEEEAQQLESESGASIYTDLQASDFRPQESKEEVKSEDEIPSTSSESETTLFDINREVEKNLNKIADYLLSQYKEEKEKNPDNIQSKQEFQLDYDNTMQLARKLLTDLLSSKIQDGLTEITPLNGEEIIEYLQKILLENEAEQLRKEAKPEIPESKVEEQTKPKTTGKERWNKLKKIVRTDSSLPQIKGKSKPLTHKDIVSQVRAEEKARPAELRVLDTNHQSYWLEAWDALHRPAFKLAGKDIEAGHFEDWISETAILEWLNEQEKKDKEMMAAFNDQKQQEGGEANFWTWKAKSKYANASPPPPTISFWDWLKQKNISIEGVQYLESEAERRPRGVTVSGGKWQDAFGDSLSSLGMEALGAPDGGQDWMIFVLSPDGKFYADAHKQGKYHHSSALAGTPIKGAGAIKVINGKLEAIADKSGHYKPDPDQMYTTLRHLKSLGVNPETYKVYIRDLKGVQGDKWIEEYEKSDAFQKYHKQQQENENTIEQRRKREKASRGK